MCVCLIYYIYIYFGIVEKYICLFLITRTLRMADGTEFFPECGKFISPLMRTGDCMGVFGHEGVSKITTLCVSTVISESTSQYLLTQCVFTYRCIMCAVSMVYYVLKNGPKSEFKFLKNWRYFFWLNWIFYTFRFVSSILSKKIVIFEPPYWTFPTPLFPIISGWVIGERAALFVRPILVRYECLHSPIRLSAKSGCCKPQFWTAIVCFGPWETPRW